MGRNPKPDMLNSLSITTNTDDIDANLQTLLLQQNDLSINDVPKLVNVVRLKKLQCVNCGAVTYTYTLDNSIIVSVQADCNLEDMLKPVTETVNARCNCGHNTKRQTDSIIYAANYIFIVLG
jgi:uncharacterized UBP type Zn finger protein